MGISYMSLNVYGMRFQSSKTKKQAAAQCRCSKDLAVRGNSPFGDVMGSTLQSLTSIDLNSNLNLLCNI